MFVTEVWCPMIGKGMASNQESIGQLSIIRILRGIRIQKMSFMAVMVIEFSDEIFGGDAEREPALTDGAKLNDSFGIGESD